MENGRSGMESLFHLCIATNRNGTSWCFSNPHPPPTFYRSSWVVFHGNVHFQSSCLWRDYPLNRMGSACQACNLLRYDVLKTKVLVFKKNKMQNFNQSTATCLSSWSKLCILRSRRMTMPLAPPGLFERGSNKKSMVATSCSGLHFEVFYLEMNRRPLPYEEKIHFYWRLRWGGVSHTLWETEKQDSCSSDAFTKANSQNR